MTQDTPRVRIESAIRSALDGMAVPIGAIRPRALGWATVDLDRAVAEMSLALGVSIADLVDAAGSQVLGARCRVVEGALRDGLSLAIMEPSTEGRLAATLARFGEGPAAVWYAIPEGDAGGTPTVVRSGPFGPERLVPGDPVHGPHRLLVGPRAGTIRS